MPTFALRRIGTEELYGVVTADYEDELYNEIDVLADPHGIEWSRIQKHFADCRVRMPSIWYRFGNYSSRSYGFCTPDSHPDREQYNYDEEDYGNFPSMNKKNPRSPLFTVTTS